MQNIPIFGLLHILLYDIFFSLFVVFVEPRLLPELKNYTSNVYTAPSLWIGILILAALAAEVPGVYLKFRLIGNRMLKEGTGKPGESITLKGGIPLYALHAAIGVSVMMFAFRAFGLDFHHDENLFRLFILAALIREGIIIYFIFTAKVPKQQLTGHTIKNAIADLCLFFFGTITFTATWSVIPESGKTLTAGSLPELILLLFFTSILFLMFYLSGNMTTVYESFVTAHSRKQLLCRFGSLLLVAACVVVPMCAGVKPEKNTAPGYSDSVVKEKLKQEEMLKMSRLKEVEKQKTIIRKKKQ